MAQDDLSRTAGGSLAAHPGWNFLHFAARLQERGDVLLEMLSVGDGGCFLCFVCHNYLLLHNKTGPPVYTKMPVAAMAVNLAYCSGLQHVVALLWLE